MAIRPTEAQLRRSVFLGCRSSQLHIVRPDYCTIPIFAFNVHSVCVNKFWSTNVACYCHGNRVAQHNCISIRNLGSHSVYNCIISATNSFKITFVNIVRVKFNWILSSKDIIDIDLTGSFRRIIIFSFKQLPNNIGRTWESIYLLPSLRLKPPVSTQCRARKVSCKFGH